MNPYQPYRSTLLTTQEVKALSHFRPARVVLDVALCWGIIFAAWVVAAQYSRWWVILLATLVIGTRYYALFIIGHDGMHRRLFRDSRLNDLVSDLFVFAPIGAIIRLNKKNHILHHQHLASEADPDRHKHGCFNKSTRFEYLFFFSGLVNLWPAFCNVFLQKRKNQTEETSSRPSDRSEGSYVIRDLVILVACQFALISGLTWAFGWWGYIVLWLFPVYVFTYCADLIRSFLEHSHPESDEKADQHRLITFLSNRVERIFLSPMNMNYHAVHHLWTSIPYFNLPRADRLIRDKAEAQGLIWRGSYLAYALKYFLALPLPECRKDNQNRVVY